MRVPRRARIAEEKSAGSLPPSLVALFVAPGGENSSVRRPCGAMWKQAREGGVKNASGGGAAGASKLRCAGPALMQERELREGSVRRRRVKKRRSHWPSATGADPAVSLGVPTAKALDRKPV
eukprot:2935290-Pleurochrysis_carterae.AAC.2